MCVCVYVYVYSACLGISNKSVGMNMDLYLPRESLLSLDFTFLNAK